MAARGGSGPPSRLAQLLMTEESVYGLILVSGVIVASASATGTSVNALVTVSVTVVVFFAAHVYAGALARLAITEGRSGLGASVRTAARRSSGMLLASVPAVVVLLLGTTHIVDDDTTLWAALIVNTLTLAVLGWIAVARWSSHWSARLMGAVVSAAFGGVLILVKAIISH